MELIKRARQSQWYGVGLLLIVTALVWLVFKAMKDGKINGELTRSPELSEQDLISKMV